MSRREQTGKAAASSAGRLLAKIKPYHNRRIFLCIWNYEGGGYESICSTGVGELASVLASALTQTADKRRKPKFIARKIALRHKRDSKGWTA